uniref:Uncharacterized protein n=1 Tax=Bicosoecida sp. CB-2014 TaxID=1486930 RepID=A0A7S1GCZ0_9STRA
MPEEPHELRERHAVLLAVVDEHEEEPAHLRVRDVDAEAVQAALEVVDAGALCARRARAHPAPWRAAGTLPRVSKGGASALAVRVRAGTYLSKVTLSGVREAYTAELMRSNVVCGTVSATGPS